MKHTAEKVRVMERTFPRTKGSPDQAKKAFRKTTSPKTELKTRNSTQKEGKGKI